MGTLNTSDQDSTAWTLEEPHRTAIERGLAWAAATPAAETDLDEFLGRINRERQRKRSRTDSLG